MLIVENKIEFQLKSYEYFEQYGKIIKLVINKNKTYNSNGPNIHALSQIQVRQNTTPRLFQQMSKLLNIISVKLIVTELKVDQLSLKIFTQKWPPEKVELLMIIKF